METHGSGSASDLVRALESAYEAIRRVHHELPPVWIVIGDGQGRGQERRAGHFAAWRWASAEGREARHELMVAGQRLADGAELVFETLLHEAAHALCTARGVKDTSRNGRYHNDRYKAAAQEVGLDVAQTKSGWNETSLSEEAGEYYEFQINELRGAIDAWTGWRDDTPPKKRQSQIRGWCGCGRVIRASGTVWEEAAILCGECGEVFVVDGEAMFERHLGKIAQTGNRMDGFLDHLKQRPGLWSGSTADDEDARGDLDDTPDDEGDEDEDEVPF